MKRKIEIFKRIISVILFAAILITITTKYCNVLRDRTRESSFITGLTCVENVDVVFIGSSVTHTSWFPYRAWDEYGITSYDYASSGDMVGAEVGTIRYVKHRQPDSKLFVIDIRAYLKAEGVGHIPVAKTNAMSHGFDRIYTILDCYNLIVDKSTMGTPLNHVFDILGFQSHREALADPEHWDYINDDVPSEYLGCTISPDHMAIDEPPAWIEGEEDVSEYAEKCIRHLLEYEQKHDDVNILFTLNPYGINEQQILRANRMAKIIEEYDGHFLNLCSDKAPYEVDYEKDFFNPRHLNVFGGEKYTHYVGQYILDNFDIEDHRGDEKYAEWDTYLENSYKKEAKSEARVEAEMERKAADSEFVSDLDTFDDFFGWYSKASSAEDLSIFMVAEGELPEVSGDIWGIFKKIGFYDDKHYYHWISSAGTVYNGDDSTIEGKINAQESPWTVTQSDDAASIVIDGTELSLKQEGINVVAWDDNEAEVVDRFVLVSDGNGGLTIKR